MSIQRSFLFLPFMTLTLAFVFSSVKFTYADPLNLTASYQLAQAEAEKPEDKKGEGDQIEDPKKKKKKKKGEGAQEEEGKEELGEDDC